MNLFGDWLHILISQFALGMYPAQQEATNISDLKTDGPKTSHIKNLPLHIFAHLAIDVPGNKQCGFAARFHLKIT
jgi:hypothetical protein